MIFEEDTRILVVAAHPDDEVLGCGGTIVRARDLGIEVAILFLGEGVSSRFDVADYGGDEFRAASAIRTKGAVAAMEELGVADFTFGSNYCCQFDTVPLLSLVKLIERKIAQFRPTVVLTHNPVEVNIDHSITYRSVEVACRPGGLSSVRTILGYEIPCSGNWTFEKAFKPNYFVDVSKSWDRKIGAWKCYRGEERPFPFPRSVEGLETMAKYRGMQSGLELAEGFQIFRHIV